MDNKIPTIRELELTVALSLAVKGWTPEVKELCKQVQGQFPDPVAYMEKCPDIVRAVGNSDPEFYDMFPEYKKIETDDEMRLLVQEVLDKTMGV